MIVDCHTHVWQSPDQLGHLALGESPRPAKPRVWPPSAAMLRSTSTLPIPPGDADNHWSQAAGVDKTIVLAFKARCSSAHIPNSYIAGYVNRFPEKLIGFASVDPTEDSARDELVAAHFDLHLRGLVLCPPSQDFHPADTRALRIYELAEKLNMPILFHPGAPFSPGARMQFARPFLLDEIARSFPSLRMIVAQLGRPWIDETLCLLDKHASVYADISGLLHRPWLAYNALLSAYQGGVIDKLLFGSDFPYAGATECIEALYSLNQTVQGTNLPMVPRESLRGIVERDSLSVLGLS
ncbi:MAG: amidohydrolase family protein [Tepidisphaerales bacterium]